jgi:hypothetical protein
VVYLTGVSADAAISGRGVLVWGNLPPPSDTTWSPITSAAGNTWAEVAPDDDNVWTPIAP